METVDRMSSIPRIFSIRSSLAVFRPMKKNTNPRNAIMTVTPVTLLTHAALKGPRISIYDNAAEMTGISFAIFSIFLLFIIALESQIKLGISRGLIWIGKYYIDDSKRDRADQLPPNERKVEHK